jgi:hypothetical protein
MSEKYPYLKFGEITIPHDDSWFQYAFRYMGYDTYIDSSANIIFLFHDTNEIMTSLDIVKDETITYSESIQLQQSTPLSITINAGSPIKIHKRMTVREKDDKIYLKGLFDIYDKSTRNRADASIFNCIYYVIDTDYHDLEKVVFSLIKLKYGTENYRFLFSYDPEILTKEHLKNIIHRILTGK